MRRIVMFNQVTADGYFAGPDGRLDWVVPEPAIQARAVEQMPSVDTILFGRRTYEQFAGFWPNALRESSATNAPDPHEAGQRSGPMRAMAIWLNETPKLVFSRTLSEVTWNNSRLVRQLDPHDMKSKKQQTGKDMIIFGSGSIVSQLAKHGLIDEYQLVVSPVFLGKGTSLLHDVPASSRLELLEATSYPSGNVMLRYAPS